MKKTSSQVIIKLLKTVEEQTNHSHTSPWQPGERDMIHMENKRNDCVRFLIRSGAGEKTVQQHL